ncbi:MAG: hypothetical protein L0H93_18925 [Nocardioides sp.]|nr:hypothetical protein [Nocardioides sp.]
MDRRTLLRSGAALTVGTAATALVGPALAESSTEQVEDPLDFVTDDMSTRDVALLLYADDTVAERDAYVKLVNRRFPDLSPREQLRNILHSGADETTLNARSATVAPMVLPIAGVVARALVAAAKRYGPSVFRSLKSAVGRGYAAFERWIDDHKFAGGIVVGVAGAAVYDVLKSILF